MKKNIKAKIKISADELVNQINDLLSKHIEEASYWEKHENFAGNTDKESWWKGAKTQATRFKAILNNEILAQSEGISEI